MSWKYVTLDKLGSISRGKSKHRPRNDKTLFGGKYPFVQTADVKAAELYLTEYTDTYNEKGLAQSKLWPAGTLCITIAANIADTSILGIDACFPDSIIGFIPYEGVSNVKFVKYAFDILQRDCKNISQGAAQDNLSWRKLSTIKFPVPEIEIQNKIVSILSAYDDLIENNRRQIKLLEEAARRLYKEWFVDLKFPGHESTPIVNGLPEGWAFVPFFEHVDITRGRSYKGDEILAGNQILLNLGNMASFGGWRYGKEKPYSGEFKEGQLAYRGDLVMAVTEQSKERRLVGHVALVPEYDRKTIFSMDLIKLLPKEMEKLFLYGQLRFSGLSREISFLANGTNILHLRPDSLKSIRLLNPTPDVQKKFSDFLELLVARRWELEKQIFAAQEARDRLLPKLMSGEIEV